MRNNNGLVYLFAKLQITYIKPVAEWQCHSLNQYTPYVK